MKKINNILSIALVAFLFTNCVEKFIAPDNSPDGGNQIISDTLYINQTPVWGGFNRPQDIIIGKETFLYVADTDNNRIVVLNLAGQIIGTREIKRPIALTQDFQLNLIVCAQFDTLINGSNVTYSAVFKLNMFKAQHHIENAKITRILPNTSFDFSRSDREYTGVTTFFDNSFYIARRGPSNGNIDPDNSILIFHKKKLSDGSKIDTLVGRVPQLKPIATGFMSADNITSLTSYSGNRYDLIVTIMGENSFKTKVLDYVQTEDFIGYQRRFSTNNPPAIQKVGRFERPEGTAIDNYGNIFVADAVKDSIFKFNSYGEELESFGGSNVFNSPHAVAYFNKTLYVADTGNNRILRFVLSTDVE